MSDLWEVAADTEKLLDAAGISGSLRELCLMEEHYGRRLRACACAVERERLYGEAYGAISSQLHGMGLWHHGWDALHVKLLRCWAKGRRVCEVGCGTGALAGEVGQVAVSWHGVDVSAVAIGEAQQRFGGGALSFEVANVARHAFPAGNFDMVYSNDLLEHLHPDDAQALLHHASDALPKGGLFLAITSSRRWGPFDVSRRYLAQGARARGMHLNETTYAELGQQLRTAGFDAVQSPPLPLRAFAEAGRLGRPLASCLLQPVGLKAFLERQPVGSWMSRLLGLRSIVVFAWKR